MTYQILYCRYVSVDYENKYIYYGNGTKRGFTQYFQIKLTHPAGKPICVVKMLNGTYCPYNTYSCDFINFTDPSRSYSKRVMIDYSKRISEELEDASISMSSDMLPEELREQ